MTDSSLLELAMDCDRLFGAIGRITRKEVADHTELAACAGGLQAVLELMVKREIIDDCELYAAKAARLDELDDTFYGVIREHGERVETD